MAPLACFFYRSGVPGSLVGGPRAYQDQFRGVKSHRVHARRDFFLHKKRVIWRKARERELATSDDNRRAVGMQNPMRDKKNKGTYRGGEGTTPVISACPEDR